MEKPFQILVVDDELDVVEMVSDILRSIFPNAQIQAAKSQPEAMGKMDNQCFDLVLVDIRLGKASGINLIQLARGLRPGLQSKNFILMSGGACPDLEPFRIGKISFIPKPFNIDFFVRTVKSTLVPQAVPSLKIDVAFITPFVDSTLYVLETMTSTKAKKEKVSIKNSGQVSGDISALIEMTSESFFGSMAISFQEKCFLYIAGNMLAEQYTEITVENQDAAAELCNQIFGRSKKILNEQGHSIRSAIPSIILGKGHVIRHTARGPCLAIEFSTDGGNFTVEAVVQAR